jgi:hypothetical protein
LEDCAGASFQEFRGLGPERAIWAESIGDAVGRDPLQVFSIEDRIEMARYERYERLAADNLQMACMTPLISVLRKKIGRSATACCSKGRPC